MESTAQTNNDSASVVIQGYRGAFHEIAARSAFPGRELNIIPAHTFDELVDCVEDGKKADFGLMAIENTLGGSIMRNYRLLSDSDVSITGEIYLRIKQNLMVVPGTRLEDLNEVQSHPMAIAQCRKFFRDYPHIRLVEAADTALSAKHIKEKKLTDVGAIASSLAADLYGLDILAEGIETHKKNHTRFLVLHKETPSRQSRPGDKVSVCFATRHEVGSLHSVLAVLGAYGANLTKIQSTPIIGKPWEYLFYVDFISSDLGCQSAIDAIQPITTYFKILGIYPQGKHFE